MTFEQIRDKLNALIDFKNVPMLKIAKQSGVAYQTVRQISLNKDANPTARTLRKLEAYLNAVS